MLTLHLTWLKLIHVYKHIHNLVVVEFRFLVVPSEVNDKCDSRCPISSRHRNYYSEAADDIFV